MNRRLRNKPKNKKGKEVHDAGGEMSVHVLLGDNFEGHQGNGLYDPAREQYRIFKVEKQMILSELLQVLANTMKYAVEQIRPWSFSLASRRPSPIDVERDLLRQVSCVGKNQNPWIIFLEVVFPDSNMVKLPPFNKDRDVLLFFKLYDPKNKRLHYCGHQYYYINAKVVDLIPLLKERAGFNRDTPLALYEEIESSEVEEIENLNDTLERALENTKDSAIIVFQKDMFKEEDDILTCEKFYRELPHKVDVTFCDKSIRADPGIDVTLSLRMNYGEVAEAVAGRVGTDRRLLQFFGCRKCTDRPGNPVQCSFDGTLKQLIECRKHTVHKKLFYCKLSIPVDELEERKTIKCTWISLKSNEEMEITLYPTIPGTVADLLEEAKKKVELSGNGPGKLRILEVKLRKIVSVLKDEMRLENLKLRGNKTLRIEEIPPDEINLADDEILTPVVQFCKSISCPIGIPLLIKVKHVLERAERHTHSSGNNLKYGCQKRRSMEPFGFVKKRILEKLEISEEEVKEFNMFFVADKKPERCDVSNCVKVEDFEWRQAKDNSTPAACLGLQHLKENRIRYVSK